MLLIYLEIMLFYAIWGKQKVKYGRGLKISTSKQMRQRLTIALAQVKAGNTPKNLLN